MDHIQVGNLLSVNRLNSEIFAVFLFQQKKGDISSGREEEEEEEGEEEEEEEEEISYESSLASFPPTTKLFCGSYEKTILKSYY